MSGSVVASMLVNATLHTVGHSVITGIVLVVLVLLLSASCDVTCTRIRLLSSACCTV